MGSGVEVGADGVGGHPLEGAFDAGNHVGGHLVDVGGRAGSDRDACGRSGSSWPPRRKSGRGRAWDRLLSWLGWSEASRERTGQLTTTSAAWWAGGAGTARRLQESPTDHAARPQTGRPHTEQLQQARAIALSHGVSTQRLLRYRPCSLLRNCRIKYEIMCRVKSFSTGGTENASEPAPSTTPPPSWSRRWRGRPRR